MPRIISISEASSIALHGIVMVAKSEKQINVSKISEQTGFSKHHIAKVMQRLVKEGYLKSLRGPNGGFMLKKDPKKINLLEIYETIEGKINEQDCLLEDQPCPFSECIFSSILNKITAEFRDYLKSKSLDEFIK